MVYIQSTTGLFLKSMTGEKIKWTGIVADAFDMDKMPDEGNRKWWEENIKQVEPNTLFEFVEE